MGRKAAARNSPGVNSTIQFSPGTRKRRRFDGAMLNRMQVRVDQKYPIVARPCHSNYGCFFNFIRLNYTSAGAVVYLTTSMDFAFDSQPGYL